MTYDKQALIELRDKVAAGEASGQFRAIMGNPWGFCAQIDAMRAYNGSLDAAKALHEAVLPDWEYKIGIGWAEVAHASGAPVILVNDSFSDARAWLIAQLNALIAQCK